MKLIRILFILLSASTCVTAYPRTLRYIQMQKEVFLSQLEPSLDSYKSVPGYKNRSGWRKTLVMEKANLRTGDSCQVYAYQTGNRISSQEEFEVMSARFERLPQFGSLGWRSLAVAVSASGAELRIICQSSNGSILRSDKYFERDLCIQNRLTAWVTRQLNSPDVPLCEGNLKTSMDYLLQKFDQNNGSWQSTITQQITRLFLDVIRPDFDSNFLNEMFADKGVMRFR